MNPIINIVKWRLSNLETELSITLDKLHGDSLDAWEKIQMQLVLRKYINSLNDYFTDMNADLDCINLWNSFVIINNIIWKNILKYEMRDDIYIYINMLYNNYENNYYVKYIIPDITHATLLCESPPINPINLSIISLINLSIEVHNNLDIMTSVIINFFMIIDKISDNLILDLAYMIKWYVFDIILIR